MNNASLLLIGVSCFGLMHASSANCQEFMRDDHDLESLNAHVLAITEHTDSLLFLLGLVVENKSQDSIQFELNKAQRDLESAIAINGQLQSQLNSARKSEAIMIGRLEGFIDYEIQMMHSGLRFTPDDFVVNSANLETYLNLCANMKSASESGECKLDEERVQQLDQITSSLLVFKKANEAFSSREIYFSGPSDELKRSLTTKLTPSMRNAGRRTLELLNLAPFLRVEACQKLEDLAGYDLEALLSEYIFDNQFNVKNKKEWAGSLLMLVADLYNADSAYRTQEFSSSLILTESRLLAYSWLNQMVYDLNQGVQNEQTLCQ